MSWPKVSWADRNMHEQRLLAICGATLLLMFLVWGVNHHRRALAAARHAEAQQQMQTQADEAAAAQEQAKSSSADLASTQPPPQISTSAVDLNKNAAETGSDSANPPASQTAKSANGDDATASEPTKEPLKIKSAANNKKSQPPKVAPSKTNLSPSPTPSNPLGADAETGVVVPPVEETPPPSSRVTPPPSEPAPALAAPKPTIPSVTLADAADAGRLHIDDGRIPNSISFTVLMDGEVLFQRGALPEGMEHATRDDLLIPPGNHELRVIAAASGIPVGESNTVKQEFKSKKKKNLRIEMRDNSSGQTVKKTAHVEPNSSIFNIELKDAGGFLGVH